MARAAAARPHTLLPAPTAETKAGTGTLRPTRPSVTPSRPGGSPRPPSPTLHTRPRPGLAPLLWVKEESERVCSPCSEMPQTPRRRHRCLAEARSVPPACSEVPGPRHRPGAWPESQHLPSREPGPCAPCPRGSCAETPRGTARAPSVHPSILPPTCTFEQQPCPPTVGAGPPTRPSPFLLCPGAWPRVRDARRASCRSRPPVSASSRRAVQVPLSVKPLGCATSKPAGPRGPGAGSVTPVPERPDVLPGLRPPCSASRQRRPTRASGGGRGWLGYCLSGSFWGRGH